MDSYEMLRNVCRIGSRVSGIVESCGRLEIIHGRPFGNLIVQTAYPYRASLSYELLADDASSFTSSLVPKVGEAIDAVVLNFVDDTLYLSAMPRDFKYATIWEWREFYDYIDKLTIGSIVSGVVKRVVPFGIFVDIGGPFDGLIDIGHTSMNQGTSLSIDTSEWPQAGDSIVCRIGYFRLHDRQVGLGWLPTGVA